MFHEPHAVAGAVEGDLAKVVADWKCSDMRDFPLRNYLIERHGGRTLRSERVQRRVEEVGDALASRVDRPETNP